MLRRLFPYFFYRYIKTDLYPDEPGTYHHEFYRRFKSYSIIIPSKYRTPDAALKEYLS